MSSSFSVYIECDERIHIFSLTRKYWIRVSTVWLGSRYEVTGVGHHIVSSDVCSVYLWSSLVTEPPTDDCQD